ncbi:MAG: hypothetical protein ACI9G1_005924 [Pirellulaceae bacterium]|jgi:hypothetical protein
MGFTRLRVVLVFSAREAESKHSSEGVAGPGYDQVRWRVVSAGDRSRIIRNPTRKRGNPASFLAYASGYYCAVFWESWRQTHVHKRLAMS